MNALRRLRKRRRVRRTVQEIGRLTGLRPDGKKPVTVEEYVESLPVIEI